MNKAFQVPLAIVGAICLSTAALRYLGSGPPTSDERAILVRHSDTDPPEVQPTPATTRGPAAIVQHDAESSTRNSAEPPEDFEQARAWSRDNLESALIWITQAPPGMQRDAVVEIACLTVAQYQPAEAIAIAERYSGGRIDLFENIVHQWAEQDSAAAEAYTLNLAPSEMRHRLLSRVAFARATDDPLDATQLVMEQIPPGDIHDEALLGALAQWIQQDLATATDWALSFSAGPFRERAVAEIANAMAYAEEAQLNIDISARPMGSD